MKLWNSPILKNLKSIYEKKNNPIEISTDDSSTKLFPLILKKKKSKYDLPLF